MKKLKTFLSFLLITIIMLGLTSCNSILDLIDKCRLPRLEDQWIVEYTERCITYNEKIYYRKDAFSNHIQEVFNVECSEDMRRIGTIPGLYGLEFVTIANEKVFGENILKYGGYLYIAESFKFPDLFTCALDSVQFCRSNMSEIVEISLKNENVVFSDIISKEEVFIDESFYIQGSTTFILKGFENALYCSFSVYQKEDNMFLTFTSRSAGKKGHMVFEEYKSFFIDGFVELENKM